MTHLEIGLADGGGGLRGAHGAAAAGGVAGSGSQEVDIAPGVEARLNSQHPTQPFCCCVEHAADSIHMQECQPNLARAHMSLVCNAERLATSCLQDPPALSPPVKCTPPGRIAWPA